MQFCAEIGWESIKLITVPRCLKHRQAKSCLQMKVKCEIQDRMIGGLEEANHAPLAFC
jgi:hypothetical protein